MCNLGPFATARLGSGNACEAVNSIGEVALPIHGDREMVACYARAGVGLARDYERGLPSG